MRIREVQQPPLEGKNRREVRSRQNKADKRREVDQLHKLLVIAVHKQMLRKAEHQMQQIQMVLQTILQVILVELLRQMDRQEILSHPQIQLQVEVQQCREVF